MKGGWLEVLLSEVLWFMKTSAIQPNHQKTFINPEVVLTLPVRLWQNKLGRTGKNNSAQQLQSRCFDHQCWSTWPNGAVMCLKPTQLVLFAQPLRKTCQMYSCPWWCFTSELRSSYPWDSSRTINSTCSLLCSRKSTLVCSSQLANQITWLWRSLFNTRTPDNVRKLVPSSVLSEHIGEANAADLWKGSTCDLITHRTNSRTTEPKAFQLLFFLHMHSLVQSSDSVSVTSIMFIQCNPATLSMCHIDICTYLYPNSDIQFFYVAFVSPAACSLDYDSLTTQ